VLETGAASLDCELDCEKRDNIRTMAATGQSCHCVSIDLFSGRSSEDLLIYDRESSVSGD